MSDEKNKHVGVEEQEIFFDKHIEDVDLASIFLDVENEAKKLARERLVKYYTKYGDCNFHKTVAQLRHEQMEEIADAINYEIFKKYVQEEG